MSTQKIPLTRYITTNATDDARRLLLNKYKANPTTYEQLYGMLNSSLKQDGDVFLRELAMIHPDRELILETIEKPQTSETKNSASGMKFSCKERNSNATGDTGTVTTTLPIVVTNGFDFKRDYPLLIAGALFATGLMFLAKTL